MAVTISQQVTFKCSTLAEYTDLLARAMAWRLANPSIVSSVNGIQNQKRVVVITADYPFELATAP